MRSLSRKLLAMKSRATERRDRTMLSGREEMEATALRKRGWSISAIARHLGRDRKTVRAYLSGERSVGGRRRSAPDAFEAFIPYLTARFADDRHVWASALYDEVVALGFPLSCQSFTRGLRTHGLRPHCEACSTVKGRATIDIVHPPAQEIQWDWDELPEAPWGGDAHLLLGTLPFSGKTRGCFADSEDQAHLVEAIDGVLRRLGGTAKEWRFDRMATVVDPATGVVRDSFVPVAKHYSASVVACPPRRGNRKGAVEKGVHFATERFWRTMRAKTMAGAQEAFDRFCAGVGDRRTRPLARLVEVLGSEARAQAHLAERGRSRPTVADLAAFEPLLALPAVAYPATKAKTAIVDHACLVAFEGNRYGVPPGLVGAEVTVRHRLSSDAVEVVTPSGVVVASHRRHTPGADYVVREADHRAALEREVLSSFTADPPCRKKANRPPGEAARKEARRLLSRHEDKEVVVTLSAYERVVAATAHSGGERR